MRGTPPSLQVEVGTSPRIVGAGTTSTTVILGNAHLTLFGTLEERQALVVELARELGVTVVTLTELETAFRS